MRPIGPMPIIRTPNVSNHFPPASNLHGAGVWPVIFLVAAHELSTGSALPPVIGAMHGENAAVLFGWIQAQPIHCGKRRTPAGSD